MQHLNVEAVTRRAPRNNRRWSVLALSVLLAACQAPQAESATEAQQTATTAQPASTGGQVPAQKPVPDQTDAARDKEAPRAPASEPPITDEDGNSYVPDESYIRANLRPEFKKCAAASNGVTPAIMACADEEFVWQQQRMRAALEKIDAGPDSEFKDRLGDEQHAYMRDTKRYCSFDPATQGQGQMLDAQSCRINRYANRADALEALLSK